MEYKSVEKMSSQLIQGLTAISIIFQITGNICCIKEAIRPGSVDKHWTRLTSLINNFISVLLALISLADILQIAKKYSDFTTLYEEMKKKEVF